MSFISNLTRAVINPMNLAQLAMGPAGWASLALRTMGSAIAQSVIQQVGQRLGLPAGVINAVQNAYAAASGTQGLPRSVGGAVSHLADRFNLSPAQQGDVMRTANEAVNDFVSRLSESEDFKAAKLGGKSGGRAGQGWLMALASVLGEKLNVMAREISTLAGEITKETPDKTAKFGAATQEFGILMNATNNAIKTIGESLSTTARKG